MVEYNDFPNTSEGVMHCKVVCTTPLRDGQKNSLQERSSPISGALHASRRLLRRWPSILDALSHSCVTARMPSKRRTIFLNTRTLHPTIFNRDIAPWCGSHATARCLSVVGRYDGAVLVGETCHCGSWTHRQQCRRAPGLLFTHCPECALARRPAGHQQAASSRGARDRGPAILCADAMSPAKRVIARASQTRPRVSSLAPSQSALGPSSARRAVDQGGRSRSGHLRILGQL